MKKCIGFVALLVSFSTIANAATRGYLYTDRRGALYFDGIDDAGQEGIGFEINFALERGSLSKADYKIMVDCLKKKETHAVQVVTTVKKIEVPSSIPGVNTSFHEATYKVACVSAPGFLEFWREKMGAN